jgi:hypothetical protein
MKNEVVCGGAVTNHPWRRFCALLATPCIAFLLAFPALATATVTSHGGPVATSPHVYEIFWGEQWLRAPIRGNRSQLERLYSEISNSAWAGILSQYWGPGGFAGKELQQSSYVDTRVDWPTNVTTQSMVTEIQEAITANASNGWPQSPTANDQFVVFTPSSATYSLGSVNYCGFHSEFGVSTAWAFVPWPHAPFTGCSMTLTAAHEYAETVTDPLLNAWKVWGSGEEVADLCGLEARGFLSGGTEVPSLYDNSVTNCSTSDATPPQMAPEAVSESATNISSTQVTAWGTGKPNHVEFERYWFEWGTTTSYGHSTTVEAWFGGQKNTQVNAVISGLTSGTTYHYRLVIEDKVAGTKQKGQDMVGTTS